ncbi:hypothetical protein BU16DRAFT_509604 [Lophium mytilinum]|uniref:AA9 family lytic polysaccharide monooxygenase n=1 Tax=Lophium mytilinum TaxID=390894 RepID=A0A6A6QTK0_9PEZI|nr:hypothetical protein BU16DRAFT_509604 [Lophium mytilinum]
MKTFTTVAIAASTLASVAHGHYIFEYLTANGVEGSAYQNVRYNTNYNSPVTDLASPDLRCNVGGESGSNTTTVAVTAGSTVTFTADVAVYHQGPVSFYMTKVADASAADGSSQWFKVKEIGPTFSGGSATWDLSKSYDVTVPNCLPASEYLLRIEQLAIHNPGGTPQFYVACAQVKVTGSGSGSPSPVVAIPGHIKATDPGYTANIYNDFTNYTVPGPKVWAC